MSLIDRFRAAFGRRQVTPVDGAQGAIVNDATATMTPTEFAAWVRGQTGSALTPQSAMSVSTVYACVSMIGGAIASIPLQFYRRESDGSREAIKPAPDLWWMFNEAPFPCWPAATAWEYAAQSLLLSGDSFWRIHRASRLSNSIVGFEPLHPDSVEVARVDDRLAYRVSAQPSQSNETVPTVTLDQDDVLHVSGPGFDGLRGVSQVSSCLRLSGAAAKAADEYQARFFQNGARPDFVLETDGRLDQQQVDRLRQQWEQTYGGTVNAWKPAILTGGLHLKPITLNAQDQQLLEARKFGVEEICRIFGVPPHMVGHTQASTSWGTGIEQMSLGFVKYTLQRHLVKFEQEINRKVFRTVARFCEFNTAGLERGDFKTRNEGYRIALGRAGEPAWMTINEVRRLENLPPVDGGDDITHADAASEQGTSNVDEQADQAASS